MQAARSDQIFLVLSQAVHGKDEMDEKMRNSEPWIRDLYNLVGGLRVAFTGVLMHTGTLIIRRERRGKNRKK